MEAVSSHVDVDKVREHYLTLTQSQRRFVDQVVNWYTNPRKMLVIVSGGPGTGKTYVVKNTLDHFRIDQLRMSFTGRSARAIGGRTIHSAVKLNWNCKSLYATLEKQLQDEEDLLKSIEASRDITGQFDCSENPRVIIVDEVAMVNGWLMYWLIRYFMDRTDLPLLFVAMGDPHQLNPVRSIHNLFSVTFSEQMYDVCKIHLWESKRFSPEYGPLIDRLREYVDKDDETGLFAFICEHFPVVEDIDGRLLARANRAMAFRNERVRKYNAFYVEKMMQGPEIVLGDKLVVKPGCTVFVTKNGCSPTAMNGTQLVFDRFEEDRVVCKDPKSPDREVFVFRDPQGKFPLDLGFCGTVHKFQGDTIDDAKIVINFDGNRNLNLVYTALSRVRDMDQILAVGL